MEEEPEEEEDIPPIEPPHPVLSDFEEAQLRSCLDKIRDIVGDSVPDGVLVEAVIQNQFDVDKSLDVILNSSSSSSVPVGEKNSKLINTLIKLVDKVCSNTLLPPHSYLSGIRSIVFVFIFIF